jgi:hypothetical protein
MTNELIIDIVDAELADGIEELDEYSKEDGSSEYSEISDLTNHLEEQTEELVRSQKLPEKDIVGQVSTTDMVIDLALANIGKQTALKMSKIERFLGKIEDQLFKDETLKEMSKADLLTLYTSTRMMKADGFKMLKEIRKDVDFENLEANLLSMHSKESLKDDGKTGSKMQGILNQLLGDSNFLKSAEKTQRNQLGVNEDD